MARLESGKPTVPPIAPENLDQHLSSHLINPPLLRSDDFQGFMADRQKRLITLIEQATGKQVHAGAEEEGEEAEQPEDSPILVEA